MSRNTYHAITIILGVFIGFAFVMSMMPPEADERMNKLIVVFWSVVPPIWLYVEDYFLKKNLTPDNLAYKSLKDHQAMAYRLWSGFALAISLLFLKS